MYRMIAVDMDGTLLDSRKGVPEENIRAIRDAAKAGKTVVIDSGRCISEVTPTLELLPEIRYVSAMSGAYILDTRTGEVLFSRTLPFALVTEMIDRVRDLDPMYQLMSDKATIQRDKYEDLPSYDMEVFRPLFDETARIVEDIPSYYRQTRIPVYVFNMYFHTPADRATAKARLTPLGVEVVFGEATGIACSLPGNDKGTGLVKLCEVTGIPLSEAISVGDADNDLPMIRAAGLGVAMGNANENVKAAADHITADCDRSGVAEVIRKFLLEG